MPSSRFSVAQDTLSAIVEDVLTRAASRGASQCETDASESFGQTVTVRCGEVDTIEHNRDKAVGVTVYIGKQRGYASTSDFAPKAIADTVDAALSIARFTASDDCNGLPDASLLCKEERDLDLFHPWDLPVEKAIDMAKAAERAAFRLDKRVVNSEGASVSCQQSHYAMGNSAGFRGAQQSSRHYISCAVIAAEGEAMQRDDWYSSDRSSKYLAAPKAIGDYAGRRALARLRSRKIGTREAKVLFEAPVANGLLGHFVSAVSGGSLYRKTSFLVDSLGKTVFSPLVNISERPFLRRGSASGNYDDEGVLAHDREVVEAGVVQGYFLSSYSARKLGMPTTGNAGGNYNLILQSGERDFEGMLREMGTGLLVTELMGQGVNQVTGDYSRGAAGYWVEHGEIQYPVEEITIAGNLKEMFKSIVAIGNDTLVRGSRECGSILLERMTIAGS
ncbi:MAG: metalloprotease PmbA [Burkholderiales bacterium]